MDSIGFGENTKAEHFFYFRGLVVDALSGKVSMVSDAPASSSSSSLTAKKISVSVATFVIRLIQKVDLYRCILGRHAERYDINTP